MAGALRTSAVAPIEILAADGATWIPLGLARPERRSAADPAYPKLSDVLAAAEAEAPISEHLATKVQETFVGGVGVPDVGYNVAPGVYTRTDGVAMAAGKLTQSQVPLGPGFSNSPVVAFAEFLGALYLAQQGAAALSGGRVCKSTDGTGVGVGAFGNTTLVLGVGEYVRDLCVFDDGAGNLALYASSSDANGLNGRLHRTTDGATWTSTAAGVFGTNGRNRMRTVHWRGNDNISAWRLVTISGRNKISYTTSAGGDPFLAASWVEGVEVKTAYSLIDITGSRGHLFFSARDGLYDIDEQGDTPNLLSSSAVGTHGANGTACEYQDGWVYLTAGDGAVRRVKVDDGAQIQELPGMCGPGWGTAARSDWLAGYGTAFAVDQGCIVTPVYNPLTHRTGIFWGMDRTRLPFDVPTRNPLVWYGPEATINADYQVKRMYVTTLAGDRRLWIGAQSVGGLQPNLMWLSLPDAGAPLDTLLSDGLHRYNSEAGTGIYSPFCRLELLPETFGDKNALHILDTVDVGSEGLSVATGTKLVVYQRADPAPGSAVWGAGRDVTASPTQSLPPTDTLQGHALQVRIDFVNPSGAATPPVAGLLDSVRTVRWDVPPTSDVRVLDVEYGDGVILVDNVTWTSLGLDPDDTTAQLKALAAYGRTQMRDPWDDVRTVKVLQVFARDVSLPDRGDHRKKVVGQLRLVLEDGS